MRHHRAQIPNVAESLPQICNISAVTGYHDIACLIFLVQNLRLKVGTVRLRTAF